ncbi:MAG TPA: hypothetical protein VHR66_28995 [Gemmataceae bacterium]|jgi:hypothetical protein|nr:hypothetical protein [Gemmataceae bacterium]
MPARLVRGVAVLGLATIVVFIASIASPSSHGDVPPPAKGCPANGWEENLPNYLKPDAKFPTEDTPLNAQDCQFHQWSWEAFVWATALDSKGVPRFMTLPTPEDLLSKDPKAGELGHRGLKLAARSLIPNGAPGHVEGAGAIVEADGNMLVAQNGYPVYASVHMNLSYFNTAKKNLIVTGGYTSQPVDSTFDVGAAVFKATWLRLDAGQAPPTGAFTTEAEVPVLTVLRTKTQITITPVPGKFTKVTVALVGLHVVGHTINHPEFLWGTFEHNLNSPRVPDNTYPGPGVSKNNYTFYAANTAFAKANIALNPPTLKFDIGSQKFSPPTNVVLQNQTGGEDLANGPGNIFAINDQGHSALKNIKGPQSTFANYDLIGTVWMKPGTFTANSDQTNAVGSVSLANSTAETFVQGTKNAPISQVQNCFMCHNGGSYSFQNPPPPKLVNRRVAISHVLAVGSQYAVPNSISGTIGTVGAPAPK